MKPGYLVHIFAALTLLLGLWLFVDLDESVDQHVVTQGRQAADSSRHSSESFTENSGMTSINDLRTSVRGEQDEKVIAIKGLKVSGKEKDESELSGISQIDPEEIIEDYIDAWRNRNKSQLDQLWEKIAACEKCVGKLVDLVVNRKLEEGMILEVAIKMAALDTEIVLPVFDSLIDPAADKSIAIILSEKLIRNGRPEFVSKIFDVIYRAQQGGYSNFAQQLTWVISKLENPQGITPILDTITGRKATSPEFSKHVTSVYSKVVRVLPDSSKAANVISDYYLQANSTEQLRLWPVVRQHGTTLVKLAVNAEMNGQSYNVQQYAEAMTELPHLNAVDSLMQLHSAIDYSPDYMSSMLAQRVADNPTIKVLHKLEDYMRNPRVKLESRIFAAEGLLAVRQNRQARYILEKVINNTQEPDAELQAYIGGRL